MQPLLTNNPLSRWKKDPIHWERRSLAHLTALVLNRLQLPKHRNKLTNYWMAVQKQAQYNLLLRAERSVDGLTMSEMRGVAFPNGFDAVTLPSTVLTQMKCQTWLNRTRKAIGVFDVYFQLRRREWMEWPLDWWATRLKYENIKTWMESNDKQTPGHNDKCITSNVD